MSFLRSVSCEFQEKLGSLPIVLDDRYELFEHIENGRYSTVVKARCDGQIFAVKCISKMRFSYIALDDREASMEFEIMNRMSHKNIVRVYEALDTKDWLFLILEFVDGPDLYAYIEERRFLEVKEARRIFQKVVEAVSYMHKKSVCHRDVKLENVIIEKSGNVKVTDFGFSTLIRHKDQLNTTRLGTRYYMAPEVTDAVSYDAHCGDVWALGVMLYRLLTGSFPFDVTNDSVMLASIKHKQYKPCMSVVDKISPGAADLLSTIFRHSTQRASLREIMEHPWFREDFVPTDEIDAYPPVNLTRIVMNQSESIFSLISLDISKILKPGLDDANLVLVTKKSQTQIFEALKNVGGEMDGMEISARSKARWIVSLEKGREDISVSVKKIGSEMVVGCCYLTHTPVSLAVVERFVAQLEM